MTATSTDSHPVLRRVYTVVRSALAGLFVLAGAAKLLHLQAFAKAVGDFGIVPEPLELTTAATLASLELVAGTALGLDIRGALGTISSLLVLFTGVLLYGIALGLDIDCGCFGPVSFLAANDLRATLLRSLAFLGACGYLYASRFALCLRPASAGKKLRSILSPGGQRTT